MDASSDLGRYIGLGDWAGRSFSGRLTLSAQFVAQGFGRWLWVHETTHDELVKQTPFGLVQLALWFLCSPQSPDGELKEHARRLLRITQAASWETQEGTATYAAKCLAERAPSVPESYESAAEVFAWLEDQTYDPRLGAAITSVLFAQMALSTPLLEKWFTDDLWQEDNLIAHLSEPVNCPDSRLPAICALHADMGRQIGVKEWDLILYPGRETDFASLTESDMQDLMLGEDLERFRDTESRRALRAALARYMPICQLPGTVAARKEFERHLVADLRTRLGLSSAESKWLSSMDAAVTPSVETPMSAVVQPTALRKYTFVNARGAVGRCSGSELVVVHPISRQEDFMSPKATITLDALHAKYLDLRTFASSGNARIRITRRAFREIIKKLPAEVSLCISHHGYDYRRGDYAGRAPVISGRRHVIFVEATAADLTGDFCAAKQLAGENRIRLCVVKHTAASDLYYIVMAPKRSRNPVVVMAAVQEMLQTVIRMSVFIVTAAGGFTMIPASLEETASQDSIRDLERYAHWFAGSPAELEDHPGLASLFPKIVGRKHTQ